MPNTALSAPNKCTAAGRTSAATSPPLTPTPLPTDLSPSLVLPQAVNDPRQTDGDIYADVFDLLRHPAYRSKHRHPTPRTKNTSTPETPPESAIQQSHGPESSGRKPAHS